MSHDKSTELSIHSCEYFLSCNNHFSLLDWLIDRALIPYSDYERWRNGDCAYLQDIILLDEKALQTLIQDTAKHCRALKLVEELQTYYSWNQEETTRPLNLSPSTAIQKALSTHWVRPQDLPQLDLFMDNSAVMVENTLYTSLAARDFEEANKCLEQLTELNNKHPKLGAFRDLILYSQYMQSHRFVDPEQLANELNGLEQEVVPLAKETLGSYARDFLAFAWRRLARSLLELQSSGTWVYSEESDEKLHPSYCLMQIPDWHAAHANLADTPGLFASPSLLLNFALCCESLKYENSAKLAWIHLFELNATFAENAVETKRSALIWSLWQDFWEQFEEAPVELFSAYVMARDPAILRNTDAFPTFSNEINTAMQNAIENSREQQNDVESRAQLKSISTLLLQIYIAFFGNRL